MAHVSRSRLRRIWVGTPLAPLIWFQPGSHTSRSRLYLPTASLHRAPSGETAGGANAWFWRVAALQRSSFTRLLGAFIFVFCIGSYVLGWVLYWLLELLIAFAGSDQVGRALYAVSPMMELETHFDLFCFFLCLISLVIVFIIIIGYEFYDLVMAIGFVSTLLRIFWAVCGLTLLWLGSQLLPFSHQPPKSFSTFAEYSTYFDVPIRGAHAPVTYPKMRTAHPRPATGKVNVKPAIPLNPAFIFTLVAHYKFLALALRDIDEPGFCLPVFDQPQSLEFSFLDSGCILSVNVFTYQDFVSQSGLAALRSWSPAWVLSYSRGLGNTALSRSFQATWLRYQTQQEWQQQAWVEATALGRHPLLTEGRALVARLSNDRFSHLHLEALPAASSAPRSPLDLTPLLAWGRWCPSQSLLLVDTSHPAASHRGGVLR